MNNPMISGNPPLASVTTVGPSGSQSGASSTTSSVGRLGADAGSFVPTMQPIGSVGPPGMINEDSLDGDLGPMPRDRCNTWPLRRPNLDINAQTSPLIHEQIPEEEHDFTLYDSNEHLGRLGASSAASTGLLHSPDGGNTFSPDMNSPTMGSAGNGSNGTLNELDGATTKKSTTRRNAWGNLSYADLITQAIMQSPEKRLTLSQVYEWMVQNVPYFRDKGDSNSSAGWKNSIRHNLSLHSRFMRIQNEGAGKSSWWVINPDAKPGRNPRRQRASTIDSTTKAQLDRKRRGARKKVMEMRAAGHSGVNSLAGSQASVVSHDIYNDDDSMQASGFEPMFRPRTQSNISVPGSSSRLSPTIDNTFDDFDFPPWVDTASSVPIPNDILDRTDQMRIDPSRCGLLGNNVQPQPVPPQQSSPQQQAAQANASPTMMANQMKPVQKQIKQENVAPPPSYCELNSVRGPSACAQNPILRTQIQKFPNSGMPSYQPYCVWSPMTNSCGQQQSQTPSSIDCSGGSLPIDLESLTLPDQPLMDVGVDVESILRHEMQQARDHTINFDL